MATNRITEEELAAAGVMVDPDGNAVFIKDKESPDESWSLTQLALFILRADETAIRFGKAEAVERYYQGQAVHFAHKKCKELRKKWGVWCERNRIRRMTAWRSERLYLAAQAAWGEEAVNQVSLHTVTDLYLAFGILKKAERGHAPGIEQEVNGQSEDTSEDDQAADEGSPASLEDAHPAIRVHTPDEDEQDESEDGEESNIDLPEGVGDEPDPEEVADDLPVLGVDEVVMRADLEADPDQFLANIRVRLELVVANLGTTQLEPEQAVDHLAGIIEAAHEIGRAVGGEHGLARLCPSPAESPA
jgi:hypothetical protein